MTDPQTRDRPARGRGSTRGGRGGFARGSRGANRQSNGDDAKDVAHLIAPEDEGEIGEMKKRYTSQMVMLREVFPDWNEIDLVFALHETDGDVQTTIDRISEGMSPIPCGIRNQLVLASSHGVLQYLVPTTSN